MDGRGQQRAPDAAAGLRKFTPEEERRLMAVVLPYTVVSLVLQCLLAVVGFRTIRTMYAARHLGPRPLLNIAASGPLLSLIVLNLTQFVINRQISRWARRLNAAPPGQRPSAWGAAQQP